MSDRNVVGFNWVLKQYGAGDERGKRALANAKAGVMYYLINKDRLPSDPIVVAFKYPTFKTLTEGMYYATPEQSDKLDKRTNPLTHMRSS